MLYFLVFTFLAFFPLQEAQVKIDQVRNVLGMDRAGLHHADLQGRLVDTAGKPLAGIDLYVMSRHAHRNYSAASTRTSKTGRFSFENLNVHGAAGLRIEPPAHLIPQRFGLDAVSGSLTDLGDLVLLPQTVLRGKIDLYDEDGFPMKNIHLKLELNPAADPEDTYRWVRLSRGEYDFVFENLKQGKYILKASFMHEEFDRIFTAPVTIMAGELSRHLKLELFMDQLDYLTDRAKMEVEESQIAPYVKKNDIYQGWVVDPEGKPLTGAYLRLGIPNRSPHPENVVITYPDCKFRFEGSGYDARDLYLCYLGHTLRIISEDRKSEWKQTSPSARLDTLALDLTEEMKITVAPMAPLALDIRGVGKETVSLSWWFNDRWVDLPGIDFPVPSLANAYIRAETSGRLLRVWKLKTPYELIRDDQGRPLPIEATLDFTKTAARRLKVTASGKPVPNARVDILAVERDDAYAREGLPVRLPLATFLTNESGEIEVYTDPDAHLEGFVYAPGHGPGFIALKGNALQQVALQPMDAVLRFTRLTEGNKLRIKPKGRPGAAAVVHACKGRRAEVTLLPGDYDVAEVTPATGAIVRHLSVTAIAGETTAVALDGDQRPVIVLELPALEEPWWADCTRGAARGGVSGAAVVSTLGGPSFNTAEWPALIEQEDANKIRFTFSGTGRFTLVAGNRSLPYRLSRDVIVEAGQRLTLDLPPLEGMLAGTFESYNGQGFFHGVAGPRLVMLHDSDSPESSGWDVIVSLPKKDEDHLFGIERLPIGVYHAYQHLIGTFFEYEDGGETKVGTRPAYAWGGIPLMVEPGSLSTLEDFLTYAYAPLKVKVLHGDGTPLAGGILQVRDWMYEAWEQVLLGPSTAAAAEDPILRPPDVPIINGEAVLPDIRKGRLEMTIRTDEGKIISLTADVDPEKVCTITLPW